MTKTYAFDRIYYRMGKFLANFYLWNGLLMILGAISKTEFDIYRILQELSKTNPLFYSELEFQFYLAWKIKEIYGDDYKICIEHPLKSYEDKNRNIDLLLINNTGGYIPIELKYRKSRFEHNIGDYTYKLKDDFAIDQTRCKYLKDISRIEHFRETEERFIAGYAIMITNQSRAWQKITNPQQTDYAFSLEDKTIIKKGSKRWAETTAQCTKNDCPEVILKENYFIEWRDYCNFDKPNGLFRVLVTEIKKGE